MTTTPQGIHVTHAAEVWRAGNDPGPTGRWVEVLEGEVRDYGGNVLFSGSADECATAWKLRTPVRLVPTKWRAIAADFVSCDEQWQIVVIDR